MALPPLRDLEDWRDVKGGSPRTPSGGIPVREYQDQYSIPPSPANGNHVAVWKAAATGFAGLIVGLLMAWWSAFQKQGVTQRDMQDYVIAYYGTEKRVIAEHTSQQDTQLGVLQGNQQRNIERLSAHDSKLHDDERDIIDLQNKVKQFGDFVEELRKAKK